MANYTLATIARKLSASNHGRFVTEDSVYQWVKTGQLQVQRIPYNERGFGKYPYAVEEAHLIDVLREKGFDVVSLFPTSQ
ncbi:hypothetical protein [Brevibacillus panacihumi]|uniref:Uncharacterized protein n=1 Tax=Brevibacillus panacihumi TaxID=497735 RepID=A0A3M8C912_9BACL|nr:hypothetical protein [Brevibacillus panacihumi]RNB72196.1 hypothetical protein EDM58_22110 [Brevibacillus panacihumi]